MSSMTPNNAFQLTQSQFRAPVQAAAQAQAVVPTQMMQAAGVINNPFLNAGRSSVQGQRTIGVNQPLMGGPAFVGKWGDKPVFGGGRLFLMV
ncbi:MAG: hypothetical protein VKJ06_02070 [Vampirovibrionales bacterium]|nr:hypothetical protein [Vampirovibrionales bacterium]